MSARKSLEIAGVDHSTSCVEIVESAVELQPTNLLTVIQLESILTSIRILIPSVYFNELSLAVI